MGTIRRCSMAVLAIVMVCAAFGLASTASGEDTPAVVSIEGSAFSPEVVTIRAGGEVIWKNKDAATHTVNADNGSFDSGAMSQGDEFRQKFAAPGTVTYSCDNHSWMKGKIEVR